MAFGYKNCLVAHLDVMGFKDYLKDTPANRDKIESYFDTAKQFLAGKESIYSNSAPEDNFKNLFVSDSIILSIEIEKDDPANFIKVGRFCFTIGLLQYQLAVKERIWTRGAISVGPLHMDVQESILVGQGFVDAYLLERVADYPRVIIDPKVLAFFDLSATEFTLKVTKDFEGCSFIGLHNSGRFGRFQFRNDALMLDWFRHGLNSSESLTEFFRDIKIRMGLNQDLYLKSNKLLGYLFESLCRGSNPDPESPSSASDSSFRIDKLRSDEISAAINQLV